MPMVSIEHILEQGSGKVNEDSLVIGNNIYGVFDGATSLVPATQNCLENPSVTGGLLASTIARDTFAGNHYSLTRLAQSANQAIMEKMVANGIDLNRPEHLWSTSAAVVRLKDKCLEWFRTGDAQILLLNENGSHTVLASQPDHDYETLVMFKDSRDNTLSNPVLKRQVLKVRAGMNKRYGVLNGDPNAMKFAASGSVDLKGVETVLLFTDGLNLPSSVPSVQKDFGELVNTYRSSGLSGLHKKIRDIEQQDPLRRKYPRFKCHDDIAAIAIRIK